MNESKKNVLTKYFPEVDGFIDVQEEAINSILSGKNTLCLMPTGGGKSLVYQIAGLVIGKTTLVISPLIALINQQNERLQEKGLSSIALHRLRSNSIKYHETIKSLFEPPGTDFLFISPERLFIDGYMEFILKRNKESIGLIVVDEAHCVSQWGHSFRPAYKLIPDSLDRIFGRNIWPTLLALTATLNPMDEKEICKDFNIDEDGIIKSRILWRDNLLMEFHMFPNDSEKRRYLYKILKENEGKKIIVYTHIKKRKYGTRALCKEFERKGFNCDYFDADASDGHKIRVLQEFEKGSLDIIFATNAFGMGIDINDIRMVIHYLLPESIEQYYQEVGRAGRDGKISKCVLLFTQTNVKIREYLIRSTFPKTEKIRTVFEEKFAKPSNGEFLSFSPYDNLSDDKHEHLTFYYLQKFGIIGEIIKGLRFLNCFEIMRDTPDLIRGYKKLSETGLILMIANKTGESVSKLIKYFYEEYTQGSINLKSAPAKCIFLKQLRELDKEILDKIEIEINERLKYRLKNFNELLDIVRNPTNYKEKICKYLDIS